jgi:hypothetical protein
MNSLIKQDSYWFVEGENDDAMMKALCSICAKKQQKGWIWHAELGYGDYDLFCSSCNNAIHIREKDEIKADSESQ